MRSILAVVPTLLIFGSACSDYSRSTSPTGGNTYPPGSPPVATPQIRSIMLDATDTVIVAGNSTTLSVFGLDADGQRVAKLDNATFFNSNAFSFLVSPQGLLTALYSSFRPFRADISASVVVDGVTLTASRRFDVRSAAPDRFDFLTSLIPEDVVPEQPPSAADGIVYLTVTDAGIDFTLLWSHLMGTPIGAHIHGPVGFGGVAGVLADFPIGVGFPDHGLLRGTLTPESIRASGGGGPISMDSLITLIKTRSVYVDIHSAERPAGEVRGTPFASRITDDGGGVPF
jgi:hypothetical protein